MSATPPETSPQWFTSIQPIREGAYAYVEMVWGPEDPKRPPRPKKGQPRQDRAPHLTLERTTLESWIEPIYTLLTDAKPRTLNAISIEIVHKNADVTAGTPFGEALWELVRRGDVCFTRVAPRYFTLTGFLPADAVGNAKDWIDGPDANAEEDEDDPEE